MLIVTHRHSPDSPIPIALTDPQPSSSLMHPFRHGSHTNRSHSPTSIGLPHGNLQAPLLSLTHNHRPRSCKTNRQTFSPPSLTSTATHKLRMGLRDGFEERAQLGLELYGKRAWPFPRGGGGRPDHPSGEDTRTRGEQQAHPLR